MVRPSSFTYRLKGFIASLLRGRLSQSPPAGATPLPPYSVVDHFFQTMPLPNPVFPCGPGGPGLPSGTLALCGSVPHAHF